jgi:hypothetical protein
MSKINEFYQHNTMNITNNYTDTSERWMKTNSYKYSNTQPKKLAAVPAAFVDSNSSQPPPASQACRQ